MRYDWSVRPARWFGWVTTYAIHKKSAVHTGWDPVGTISAHHTWDCKAWRPTREMAQGVALRRMKRNRRDNL